MKKIKKDHLMLIFERLKDSHTIIGPKIESDVIILGEIDFHDIPAGYKDHQGAGFYRLSNPPIFPSEIFSFSIGPDSFKRFLSPPLQNIFIFKRSKKGITIDLQRGSAPSKPRKDADSSLKEFEGQSPSKGEKPIAFFGMRACDISALKLFDKVFLEGPVRDQRYDLLRRNTVIIAVNCLFPGGNCFCNSMGAGPEIKDGFDIAITELGDSFLFEAETVAGEKILNGLALEEVSNKDINMKLSRIDGCKKAIIRSVRVSDCPWVIYRSLEHPRWTDTAKRCLACGNCTQVCPTCFCNSMYDRLGSSVISEKSSGISGRKIRVWDSCFSKNFARVHGGNFRPSKKARYRHWVAHKLAYWIEQFGRSGCVGCGRCITWCPVGIDITEELEALRVVR